MNIFLIIFLLLASAFFGGLLVMFISGKNRHYLIKLLLAFSGGFLLSIAFLHFLPEIYESHNSKIGLCVLLGFLIQLLLEYFSEGVEHGHIHTHENDHSHSHHPKNGKSNVPLMILISLSIHSLIEGLPLVGGVGSGHHHEAKNSLLYGIILHQLPVAIALTTVFMANHFSKTKTWIWLAIFAAMTPIGVLIGYFTHFNSDFLNYILAVVVGMFIHISTTIIFESGENHRYNLAKLSCILLGGFLASLL